MPSEKWLLAHFGITKEEVEKSNKAIKKRNETTKQKKQKKLKEPDQFQDEYTIEDLEKAREELEMWQEKFGNSNSNNPNKYSSEIREAASRVRIIEEDLRTNGIEIDKDRK